MNKILQVNSLGTFFFFLLIHISLGVGILQVLVKGFLEMSAFLSSKNNTLLPQQSPQVAQLPVGFGLTATLEVLPELQRPHIGFFILLSLSLTFSEMFSP